MTLPSSRGKMVPPPSSAERTKKKKEHGGGGGGGGGERAAGALPGRRGDRRTNAPRSALSVRFDLVAVSSSSSSSSSSSEESVYFRIDSFPKAAATADKEGSLLCSLLGDQVPPVVSPDSQISWTALRALSSSSSSSSSAAAAAAAAAAAIGRQNQLKPWRPLCWPVGRLLSAIGNDRCHCGRCIFLYIFFADAPSLSS